MEKDLKADICIVGGGSGGLGAAICSARSSCRTILVEKEKILGGNSTLCGVNCWEPVAGVAYGLPAELYKRMRSIPNGCGIYHNAKHFCLKDPEKKDFPGALFRIDPSLEYKDTLKRGYIYGGSFEESMEKWNGVIFEPSALHNCALQILREAGAEVILGHGCREVESANGRIVSIRLDDGRRIFADHWIDNTGLLAASAKCPLFMGQDPACLYKEPDAPEVPGISLNGVTLLFRVTPCGEKRNLPEEEGRRGVMVATQYPNGDYNCNMLPTMSGNDFFVMERELAMEEMRCRVKEFWNYVQKNFSWGREFQLKEICTKPGIRESFRTGCCYMLNENDLLAGVKEQEHNDLIAIADHQMDLHGAPAPRRIVHPYGIPYRCLLPEGVENLLVAGRVGGFSFLASSSCRLSRTMIRLGEAAGTAAAMAVKEKRALGKIDIKKLQEFLAFQEELSALCL